MISSPAAILLCLLGCNVWKAVTKTLQEPNAGVQEVTLKVQVSDVSTHQPISDAVLEVFANQVSAASGKTGTDGTAIIKLQYRLGSQLIVTATKHAYVPNSAPWRPLRLPVFSSLSLCLLPERSATLMVYDDIVQIVSGFQGSQLQPRVHFERRALDLPANATYKDLAAFLTAASTPWEVDSFPYLQGSDGNATGNSTRFDLTPVTAISIHLLNGDGTNIPVNGPIFVTVPLPTHSNLKHNAHVPAWRFDQKHGTWLKSSLGIIQQERNQLTWTYIAPQMGYWVAAMSPSSPDPVVTQDIATYHTVFLLAILGGMAFILLVLLCLLLYYCRRKCLKPRQHHRKLQLSTALDCSKKDQATSMSHINLISPGHMEMMSSSGEADIHTPMLKPSYNTSREFSSREELLSHQEEKSRMSFDNLTSGGTLRQVYNKSLDQFLLKSRKSAEISDGYGSPGKDEYRRSYNSVICQSLFDNKEKDHKSSSNRIMTGSKPSIQEQTHPVQSASETEQMLDRRPTECMSRSVDHLERPTSFPRPGQLICYNSVDQVNDNVYRNVLPTLVIPAHYMKLSGEHPIVSQQMIISAEQQFEIERIQAELSSHAQQAPQQMQNPQLGSQAISQQHLQDGDGIEWSGQNTVLSESVSIPASLNDAAIAQMNGEVQLLTEKALMELGGGRPMPHPRAWFVSLDGRSNAHIRHSYIDLQRAGKNGSNDASLDSGVDMNEPKIGRKGRSDKFSMLQRHQSKQHPTVPEHQHNEETISNSPTYTKLVYLDDLDQSGSECGTAVCSPEDNKTFTEVPGRRSGGQLPSLQEETIKRTVDSSPVPLNSPEHELSMHDDDDDDDCAEDQGENKKSPWQKREERPLLTFNMK
ncbi:FAM171A1 isoform X1 [Pelobates cultripes]|uniref:FAM171A1 isoform X1 n=2 Tax=Pelobates cultripes TaxID=61616 RepID=A0AAD1RXU3_PELCU|nr:FAM171A1 isoform X1 [Pelobates cultripes]